MAVFRCAAFVDKSLMKASQKVSDWLTQDLHLCDITHITHAS